MSLAALVYESSRLWNNASKSPDKVHSESLGSFRRALDYAWKRTKFYPAYWKDHGITYKDLKTISPEDIPCITKEVVRSRFDEIAAVSVTKNDRGAFTSKSGAVMIHSSGSTGTPAWFLYGKHAITIIEANFVRLSNLGGNNPVGFKDLPIRNLHAASVGTDYASTILLRSGLSKYHAVSTLLKPSEPLSEWVGTIGESSPNYLSGYPSCLSLLLDLQKSGHVRLHPLKIIAGGEPLKPGLKKELQEVFGADIIDYYGCSESLLVGAGSSWYDGIYLFDDMNYCEIDEQGHLILTPLYNPEFPLVRYKLDDLVQGFTKDYRGELPFTHIDKVLGRDEDVLWFLNGKGFPDFLHPLVLDDLNVEVVRGFQIVQIDKHSFRIDYTADAADEGIERKLKYQMNNILKGKRLENLHYEIRFCTNLKVNPRSGKIPLTVKL